MARHRGTPLLEITIGQALDQAARQWGNADALVSVAQGIRWSWSEMTHKADAVHGGRPPGFRACSPVTV